MRHVCRSRGGTEAPRCGFPGFIWMGPIQAAGLDKNTLVIFTSDNGGQLNVGANNGTLRDGKQSMYEGGIRVPLIVRWPGKIKPGSVCDSATISMDYFPTFLEMAGLDLMPEAHLDGESMVPLFNGKVAEPRTLFWHFPHRQGVLAL